MDLSIIIVSWNVRDKLRQNLESLMKVEGDFNFETIVVDNNSSDGTVAMVKENFPMVKVIANSENLGFAKANNQAIKKASGDYVLLLNPDMEVYPDTLEIMLDWFKNNSQVTVASCRLVDIHEKNIPHARRFPTLSDQLAIVLKLGRVFPGLLNKYFNKDLDYSQPAKVDSVRGAFFMINRNNYKKLAGQEPLLDERYFVWFEEVDFCKTVYKLGGEVWYVPLTKAIDHVGASFSQLERLTTQKYFRDSMLKYFAKWHKPASVRILRIAWSFTLFFLKLCPKKSR